MSIEFGLRWPSLRSEEELLVSRLFFFPYRSIIYADLSLASSPVTTFLSELNSPLLRRRDLQLMLILPSSAALIAAVSKEHSSYTYYRFSQIRHR